VEIYYYGHIQRFPKPWFHVKVKLFQRAAASGRPSYFFYFKRGSIVK